MNTQTDFKRILNVKENKTIASVCRKKKFSNDEDKHLINLVTKFSTKNWQKISLEMNGRSPKECRARWQYFLSPKGYYTQNSNNDIRELKNGFLNANIIMGNNLLA